MKEKILYGWNLMRVLYLLVGGYMITQSILQKEWTEIIFGVYFLIMAIFRLGCAGNCMGGSCAVKQAKNIE